MRSLSGGLRLGEQEGVVTVPTQNARKCLTMSAKWAIFSYRMTAYSVISASVSLTAQHIAPLEEQCNNSKSVIFQDKLLKEVL